MDADVKALILKMADANPFWDAPKIHGELLKLGIIVSERTVSGLLRRHRRKPPSQTWRTFIKNHMLDMVGVDFLVVPTIGFQLLFVFIILSHARRRVVHFNVTANPTAEWTAQQIIEAFPWDTAPRYLLRDRDSIYGDWFRQRVKSMGIKEVLTAYQSPWQNPYVERLHGSIRRECTDHLIVLSENHLRRILRSYFAYYHEDRTHLGLEKDTPLERPISIRASSSAKLIELPRVGEFTTGTNGAKPHEFLTNYCDRHIRSMVAPDEEIAESVNSTPQQKPVSQLRWQGEIESVQCRA